MSLKKRRPQVYDLPRVVDDDPATKAIFEQILRDEVFHMNYTYSQLSPASARRRTGGRSGWPV